MDRDFGVETLRWLGVADAPYGVEARTNLMQGSWSALATVTGIDGITSFPIPASSSPSRFFRVLFPQPVVTAGEPAFAAAEGGTAVYITGQFFYPGDIIRVGGLVLSNVTFISSTLLSGMLPTQTPGLYDIEVISGQTGAILATLPAAIEISPPFERTLLEPPEWPPAGPSPTFKKEFKGHVTLLKAFDDEEPPAAARHTKTGHVTILKAFDDEEPPAASKHTKSGHVTLLKAFDDTEPPAAARHTKTGHVTILKAFDDEGPALSLSHAYLKRKLDTWISSGQSSARGGKTGHVTLMKAFDDEADAFSGKKEFKGHVTLLKAFDDEDASAARGIEKSAIKRTGINETLPYVRLHSGETYLQVTDLALAGRGLDFVWARTYRSRTGTNTTQGANWAHAYDVSIQRLGGDILIHGGTGRTDTFRLQPDGTYVCPGIFREGGFTNGVFRLTFADTGFWEFRPLDTSPASGKLARIEDRNGNAITLSYDGSGRLAQITDTLGRVHTVAYTTDGNVASVSDSTGRTVSYGYYGSGETGGSAGDLKTVTSPPVTGTPNGNDFPGGKTESYTYTSGHPDPRDNHLLLTVTDGKGQTAATCVYDLNPASATHRRVLAIQQGDAPAACLTYLPQTPSPDNRFAAMRCIVNDPAGNVTESFFDLRNRCVAQREFTGRATPGLPVTATENRPAGKLRAADPDYYETLISWNNDSLCTRITLPGGLAGRFLHAGDTSSAALWRMRKRAEVLFAEWDATAAGGADTDGDGAPDLFKISSQYTYDPRFGSDPTVLNNMRTRIDQLESQLKNLGLLSFVAGDHTPIVRGSSLAELARIKPRGWNGTVKGVSLDGRDDDCDGFATTVTDPRGTVTTATYDAHGNCTRIVTPFTEVLDSATPSSAWDIAYDPYGQISAITHAPDATGRRRVTSFGWQLGHLRDVVEDAAPGGLALTTTFERDARGNVTRAVDPSGHDALYVYNALDQLVSRSSPPAGDGAGQRVATTFFYDANDNIVRMDTDNRRENGASVSDNPVWTTRFAYDASDRRTAVVTEVDAATAVTNRFEYDANGQLAAILAPPAAAGTEPDNRADFAYDERGLLFRCTEAPGSTLAETTEFSYTADGKPATKRYVDGSTEVFAYDGFGRVRSVTDANGNVVSACFDSAGDLVLCRAYGEATDAPGGTGNRLLSETRWSYDRSGRCVASVDSFFDIFTELAIDDGARTTRFAYAPNGQCVSVTNDLGYACSYAYDTAGRLASATGPRGDAVSCERDALGNIVRVTARNHSDVSGTPPTFVSYYAYDALSRCVAASDNVGNTNRWHYDSRSLVVRTTDALGNETRARFDGRARLTDTIAYVGPCDADADGVDRGITISTTHVEYDAADRVLAVTDANTNTTTYAYDARNRIIAVTRPDGTSRHLVWSPRSNLAQEEDAGGTVITYSYDPLNRLIRKDVACGAGVAPTTTAEAFAYDGLSRLVSASNDVSQVAFAYDSLGNMVSSVQDGLAVSCTYDSLGNRRTCTCPSGYIVHTTYDALNHPAAVSVMAGGALTSVASFDYDGPGRLARIVRANGINTRVFWNGLQNAANAAGDFGWQQMSRINHARAGGGQVVDQRSSAYDRSQNRILRAQTVPFLPGGTLATDTFGYDSLDRMTAYSRKNGALVAADYHYRFDGMGNRVAVTNSGVPELYARDATLPEPGDFQMDQYTATPFGSNTYDAVGNLLSRDAPASLSFYHYDYAGRLVQVDGLNGAGLVAPVAAFDYDALGRRIAKTTFPAGLPPETERYVRGGEVCDDGNTEPGDGIVETRKGAAVSSVSVLAGAGGGAAAASYAATGRMMAPPVAIISGAGELFYTHVDDLGNVLALTDAAGSVVERCDYDAFGAPTFLASDGTPLTDSMGLPATSSPAGNPHLFRGMAWDGETGLYIEGSPKTPSRYFDPKTGQYLSRDGEFHGSGDSDRAFENNSAWTLKKEEGGRHTPFFKGYSPPSSVRSRDILKSYFQTGDKPTQSQFSSLIDSVVSRSYGKARELKGHVTLIK